MSKKPARAIKLNVINEPKDSYTGGPSSLCPGCGHDQISNVIVNAAWENGIKPHRIAKMSGIGCSSKTPAYYLGQSHGFNTVHGRMPSVTTGAYAINKDLLYLGVSGDGDSASIGIGQLIHAIRRNMDMVYIVENNGVYGLTKGQYSATADIGSKKKKGKANETQPIDLCALAINLGCTFVARSFSGSKKQLTSLLKAAMSHKGFALIDVISPCVTFNNNDESMRSYQYVKENEITLHMADYIPHFEPMAEVEVPEKGIEKVLRCNCSICKKKGYIIGVLGPNDFKLIKGEEFLKLYQFNTKTAKHYFCSICGIHTHNRPRIDPRIYGVNIACIEGVRPFEIKNVPISDGENHPLDQKK